MRMTLCGEEWHTSACNLFNIRSSLLIELSFSPKRLGHRPFLQYKAYRSWKIFILFSWAYWFSNSFCRWVRAYSIQSIVTPSYLVLRNNHVTSTTLHISSCNAIVEKSITHWRNATYLWWSRLFFLTSNGFLAILYIIVSHPFPKNKNTFQPWTHVTALHLSSSIQTIDNFTLLFHTFVWSCAFFPFAIFVFIQTQLE